MKNESLVLLTLNIRFNFALYCTLEGYCACLLHFVDWASLPDSDTRTQDGTEIVRISLAIFYLLVLFVLGSSDVSEENCQGVGFSAFAIAS